MSAGNVAPQHFVGRAGKERECGMGRDVAPRHGFHQPTRGQARIDVPDVPNVPHPMSTTHLTERRPGLKALGCS